MREVQRIAASSDSSVRTVAGPLNTNADALREAQAMIADLQERVARLEEPTAVLGRCPHGVDLDREFCPHGCRV